MSAATSDPLCNNLLQGMHTAAQPLAVLRAGFYPDSIERMNKGELKELALSATVQVERLCTLFSYLQQLVAAASTEPRIAPVKVSSLLENVIDGVDLWFLDSGISLHNDNNASGAEVAVDSQRTQQALSAVLLIAHNLSSSGHAVVISTANRSNDIQIDVRNESSTIDRLNGESSLGMAVAETHINGQHGTFSYSLHPLAVTISLPK